MDIKATFRTSGTQLRVKQGDILVVDRIVNEPGSKVVYDDVLLVEKGEDITLGNPVITDASVHAEVIEHFRGKKVRVYKMRRRKASRRTRGHRSELSRIRITDIKVK